MALEPLTLAPAPFDGDSNGGRQQSVNGADDGNRAPRLPRWTRQEILVLIQGKRVAENRVRRGRTAGLELGSGQVEPKWASVSSYCKKHGVNRGPVQCRKRWSNLAGDFKKIKEWECGIKEESESFWVMRNDLRRERKLPGFFDREVYQILDRGSGGEEIEEGLALALAPAAAVNEPEALFDSGRSAAADEGLFSDFEQSEAGDKDKHMPIPAPTPISEQQYQPLPMECHAQGINHQKEPTSNPDGGSAQEGKKRKRGVTDTDEEADNLQHQLAKALERNGNLLSSQLEAQNAHYQLDREQRKDHVNSLVAVLDKLADAMVRIADKL
ncbi:trihelix transcription factor ASR3 isoform X1 [Nicotiana tomentosiformis]|uniref:trihelix transcription factor ASR3 isoform X1 n=1 Tax=Nicotiana tomentosiformis TaxID=4098 RepID=UPI00051C6E99|nr:trihelix transcription factor ASR3 isoform X1 [Nicotiana tomentosiformis]